MTAEAWGMQLPLPQAFGEAIREIRHERGLNQEEVALTCDLDRAYYGHIERGVHNPTIVTVWKIAEGLGVKPATLIRRAERHMQESI